MSRAICEACGTYEGTPHRKDCPLRKRRSKKRRAKKSAAKEPAPGGPVDFYKHLRKKAPFTCAGGSGQYQKGTALSYHGVLDQIVAYLRTVEQWASLGCFTDAAKYFHKAEALIELLEVHNCGSSGGFDAGQPEPMGAGGYFEKLKNRYAWLYFRRPRENT